MTTSGSRTASTLLRQLLPPCTCSGSGGSGSRAFSSSVQRAATVLKAEKLDKNNDPLDMTFLQEFGYDDLPARAHRTIEADRERLHLLRLVQFQLPEIKSKAAQLRRAYEAPPSQNVVNVQTIYHPADPDHPASRKAVISVSAEAIQSRANHLADLAASRKFRILAGSRFDPRTDTVKISCDRFPTLSMNQKWCSDALDRLIKEAEDLEDPLTDFPDATKTREARSRLRPKKAGLQHMPKSWLSAVEIDSPALKEDLRRVKLSMRDEGKALEEAEAEQSADEQVKAL